MSHKHGQTKTGDAHYPAYAASWDTMKQDTDEAWERLLDDYAANEAGAWWVIRDAPTGHFANAEAWIASDCTISVDEVA